MKYLRTLRLNNFWKDLLFPKITLNLNYQNILYMLEQKDAPMDTEVIQVRDVVANQVYRTTNYERFSILHGNRSLNPMHFERLKTAISTMDLTESNPILVNDDFEIIDGQHRFEVCKYLKKPIYYLLKKGYGLREVQMLNANMKNWRLEDYVDGYCDLGNKEYLYLRSFLGQHKLGMMNSITVLSSMGSHKSHTIMDGTMTLPNKARGETIAKWVEQLEPLYAGVRRKSFINALIKLHSNRQFEFKQLMAKLAYQQTKLVDCTDMKGYLTLLEEIYNFKERGTKLRFF